MRTAEFDREQVLEAAMDVFCKKGYVKTTMQDLKEATGLHPGSIYCAFKNKRGMLLAALDHFIQSRWQQSQLCLDSDDPLDGIQYYLHQLVEKLCMHHPHCLLSRTVADFSSVDGDIRDALEQPWQELLQRLEKLLIKAQQQGGLKPAVSPRDGAWLLLISVFGLRGFPPFMADEKSLHASIDLQINLMRRE